MFRVCRICQWKEEKGEGKDEALHDKLGDDMEVCDDVEVYEDVEVCEDVEMYEDVEVCEDVVKVQDRSVVWPGCLRCWCSLTTLVLDQAGG